MKIGVLMDPIEQIKPDKDTSLALMKAAGQRGHELYYLTDKDLWLQDGIVWGQLSQLDVNPKDKNCWYELIDCQRQPLSELDVLLMRKDPPFNMNYIYLTYLLEMAEQQGVWVINNPRSLRDANEKLFTTWFPQCCPSTLVSSNTQQLYEFVLSVQHAVLKPLDSMGGHAIFQVKHNDPNLWVILETMTDDNKSMTMAQQYIPQVVEGDKRIILINGQAIPYALARVPKAGDFRGNISAGASYHTMTLTEHDLWIVDQVAPVLQEKGLLFVGLDVIGEYLTEINVTSPTCVREIEQEHSIDICGQFIDYVEVHVRR